MEALMGMQLANGVKKKVEIMETKRSSNGFQFSCDYEYRMANGESEHL